MYQLKFNEMLGNSSALGDSSITLKWPKFTVVSQSSTCAEDRCKDPALAIAHRVAIGRDPAVKDVCAAAPVRRPDTILVAARPLTRQYAQVIVTIYLRQEEKLW